MRARIERFMRALGSETRGSGRVYFTGGATAVLYGWRTSTIHRRPEWRSYFRTGPKGTAGERIACYFVSTSCKALLRAG